MDGGADVPQAPAPNMNPFMRTFVPRPVPPAAPSGAAGGVRSFAYSSARAAVQPSYKRQLPSNDGSASSEEDNSDDDAFIRDDFGYDDAGKGRRLREGEDVQQDGLEQEMTVGMRMLLKMGWSQGSGLGVKLQGRVNPVEPTGNSSMMGLGKARMDNEMLESTISAGPRELESQRIAKETTDQRQARLEKAQHMAKIRTEIAETLQKFVCDICDKPYANVGQYNEHLKSYDHHHRARAVANRQAEKERLIASGEADKRRQKEQKREAKEMAKIMGAAGIKVDASSLALAGSTATKKAASAAASEDVDGEPLATVAAAPVVKKTGGWAKVGSSGSSSAGGFAPISGGFKPVSSSAAQTSEADTPQRGFKKSGWAPAGSAASNADAAAPVATPTPPADSSALARKAPAFRSGGTFRLDNDQDKVASPASAAPPPLPRSQPPSAPPAPPSNPPPPRRTASVTPALPAGPAPPPPPPPPSVHEPQPRPPPYSASSSVSSSRQPPDQIRDVSQQSRPSPHWHSEPQRPHFQQQLHRPVPGFDQRHQPTTLDQAHDTRPPSRDGHGEPERGTRTAWMREQGDSRGWAGRQRGGGDGRGGRGQRGW